MKSSSRTTPIRLLACAVALSATVAAGACSSKSSSSTATPGTGTIVKKDVQIGSGGASPDGSIQGSGSLPPVPQGDDWPLVGVAVFPDGRQEITSKELTAASSDGAQVTGMKLKATFGPGSANTSNTDSSSTFRIAQVGFTVAENGTAKCSYSVVAPSTPSIVLADITTRDSRVIADSFSLFPDKPAEATTTERATAGWLRMNLSSLTLKATNGCDAPDLTFSPSATFDVGLIAKK